MTCAHRQRSLARSYKCFCRKSDAFSEGLLRIVGNFANALRPFSGGESLPMRSFISRRGGMWTPCFEFQNLTTVGLRLSRSSFLNKSYLISLLNYSASKSMTFILDCGGSSHKHHSNSLQPVWYVFSSFLCRAVSFLLNISPFASSPADLGAYPRSCRPSCSLSWSIVSILFSFLHQIICMDVVTISEAASMDWERCHSH